MALVSIKDRVDKRIVMTDGLQFFGCHTCKFFCRQQHGRIAVPQEEHAILPFQQASKPVFDSLGDKGGQFPRRTLLAADPKNFQVAIRIPGCRKVIFDTLVIGPIMLIGNAGLGTYPIQPMSPKVPVPKPCLRRQFFG